MAETRRGFLLGFAAYAMWGLFPLYWPLLEPAGAIEILAHRIFWSMAVMAGLILALGRRRQLRKVLTSPRTRGILALAAVVIAVNWGTYIWGVNNGHVVETSLGYFINPLVTVLMGVVVLGERLRTMQWVAMGIATVAVVGLTVEYGRPPWVALVLAFSFGSYGLAKKKANTGAVESLTVETLVLAPVAAGYLLWLGAQGTSTFTTEGAGHVLLIVGTGVVTAIPLICFGAAATRVSMTTIGLLQYVAPTIQFALGVFLFGEPMPAMRWVGFTLVWLALAIFTFEALTYRRRQLRLTAEASAL
ncbi:EamA family transporter RarD [Nocardioides sp. WL0053]|uniref:EamA family transporter RarD n=1 Tax=Nocardioides jiangsuensis TaxID=2866161 RepID=A0ABS7RL57_9ACTN|nr:EamA family transporter RarD [Nocardioides jiangsuensis]MBY9074590.1 EamA family transporter RarD [Nocardioides jiangsuensis]